MRTRRLNLMLLAGLFGALALTACDVEPIEDATSAASTLSG